MFRVFLYRASLLALTSVMAAQPLLLAGTAKVCECQVCQCGTSCGVTRTQRSRVQDCCTKVAQKNCCCSSKAPATTAVPVSRGCCCEVPSSSQPISAVPVQDSKAVKSLVETAPTAEWFSPSLPAAASKIANSHWLLVANIAQHPLAPPPRILYGVWRN